MSFHESDDENNSELRKGLKELGLLGDSEESPIPKKAANTKSVKRPPVMKKPEKKPAMNESVSISDMDFDDVDEQRKKTPVKSAPPPTTETPKPAPVSKQKQPLKQKAGVPEKKGPGIEKDHLRFNPLQSKILG